MSGERDELARLVQELPDEQVPKALEEVRGRLRPARQWPPAWFGIAPGDGTDIAARSEDVLAEGFGR
ncbi:hypothetical protein [Fodinicola feengrottensis]|uniref:Uncharacterized protein n=1 Tax=Fodinicola feengrottensis TaxID=435914 RepID=A0ABN2J2T4_9ACTN|nr:hypothetical protein [Fodinicola feengrottensis]